MNLNQFLKGKRFQDFKLKVLDFYGNECGQCGSRCDVSVFYKTFDHIKEERLSDMIVLCKKHGIDFLKERKAFSRNIKHPVTKSEVQRISTKYVKRLLNIKKPSPYLVDVKRLHLKIKRELNRA